MADCINLFLAMSTIDTKTDGGSISDTKRNFLYLFGVTSAFFIHSTLRNWWK